MFRYMKEMAVADAACLFGVLLKGKGDPCSRDGSGKGRNGSR